MLMRILVILLLSISFAHGDSRLIIHLADYLANDYAGAVSKDGKVLSDGEYAEQVEFAQTALKEAKSDLTLNQNSELLKNIAKLDELIQKKSSPELVVPLARLVQKQVITISKISLSPSNWPDYDKAKKLFEQKCINCHGPDGRGDGPDGKDLDPAPSNFHDLSRAPLVSPFAAFNTIRLGVPGTGMMSHPELSDEDVWSLAFYVNTFRFGIPKKDRGELSTKISNDDLLVKSASLNDVELEKFLESKQESKELVSKIRLFYPETDANGYIQKARNLLNSSYESFKSGDLIAAEKLSLDAYFLGIEPIENKIAVNDPEAVNKIEELMASIRNSIKNNDKEKFEQSYKNLLSVFDEVFQLIQAQKTTPGLAFMSGFSIILREGFEAVLVVLAILGVAKVSGSAVVTGTIHAGWIFSIILGVVSWFLSGILISMSGVSREVMEAITSFLAVFVLIYVGFWMHRQTEIHRWKTFINEKVRNLTQTQNLVGLFLLSFLVTFREVFETVLFLRTIYVESDEIIRNYLFGGVAIAFVIVLAVSIAITRFRNKIPLQKFFTVSAVLMMGLATILAGKGIHALQEAGIISMNIFPVKMRMELFGIFPSWETFITQLLILTISIFIWKSAGKSKKVGAA